MAIAKCRNCLQKVCCCDKNELPEIELENECLVAEGIYKNVTVTIDSHCNIISMVDSDNQTVVLCDKCR